MSEQAAAPVQGRLARLVTHPAVVPVIEAAAVVIVPVAIGVLLVISGLGGDRRDGPLEALNGLVVGLAALGAYLACQRWLERRADHELTLPGAGRELAAGLFGGFALFAIAALLVALLGGLTFAGVRGWGQIWPLLGMALYSGPFEEVLFRGIALRHLERPLGTWGALGVTAAFFGAAHLTNVNASAFAALAISLEAGILLGAAYLATRRLWLAIGIHSGWNFTQGWVFSIPVSGSEPPIGLLITRRDGPDWLTGGEFGLEASVVAMAVATLAGLALLVYASRRGLSVAPGK